VDILVENVAPTVTLEGMPPSCPKGMPLTLDCQVHDVSPADREHGLHYSWNVLRVGGGFSLPAETATAARPFTFTPTDVGVYMVCVTVTDKDGSSASDSRTLSVTEVVPTVSITGPASGQPGQPRLFTLTASDSSADQQATGFTYDVNWGDGTPLQRIRRTRGNGAGVRLTHTYTRTGNFTILVIATDKAGLLGQTTSSIAIAHQ
jgi:hypothetical protein